MATQRRAQLSEILPLVIARLQAVTGFTDATCFLSQLEDMPYDGHGDQYLWVRVLNRTIQKDIYEGGGRIDTRETRILKVTIRTRLGLDEPGHDTSWLTDASLGHLDLADAVSNALGTWHVEAANGDILACCPLEPTTGTQPRKDRKQTEWGEETLDFLLSRELNQDQTYT